MYDQNTQFNYLLQKEKPHYLLSILMTIFYSGKELHMLNVIVKNLGGICKVYTTMSDKMKS